MAKPTKHAPLICTIVSVLALIGIIAGLLSGNALWILFLIIPAAIYEAYRTEGTSTKLSSFLLLGVIILEILLVLFNVNFNLAEFIGTSEEYIGGYLVPLGDIKIVGPTVMAILAVVLFVRTAGIFTRWLAVAIFVTAFSIVYVIDPTVFSDLIRFGVQEGLRQI
ncbi:MAG: hypothetical protein PHG63_04170 [Candidatus Dojkabacteria bacterium]|nr:hypothetical protein [Candidatus Dojkabacteria bacterium]